MQSIVTKSAQRPATGTPEEVARALATRGTPAPDTDPGSRLVWHRAWSIRGRKGARTAFLARFRGRP
ncbi:MAG: hypothetical protein AAGD47_10290 [Pseudomonadota bacterium]